jgi:hypothetical protein
MNRDNVRMLRPTNSLRLVLPAGRRSRLGFVDHAVISDISEGGCRIDSLGLIMGLGEMVVVRPQGLEGLCRVLLWARRHSAGIEFDRALYPAMVDHLPCKLRLAA